MVLESTSVQTIVSGSNHPFIFIFRIYRVYRKTVALVIVQECPTPHPPWQNVCDTLGPCVLRRSFVKKMLITNNLCFR